MTIASSAVSREHAQIKPVPGGIWIVDPLAQRHAGQRRAHPGESRWLVNGDTVLIGGEALRFLTGQETRFESSPLPLMATTHAISFPGDRMTIGRDAGNDVVLEDPNVSRLHAEVVRTEDASRCATSARATAPGWTAS